MNIKREMNKAFELLGKAHKELDEMRNRSDFFVVEKSLMQLEIEAYLKRHGEWEDDSIL